MRTARAGSLFAGVPRGASPAFLAAALSLLASTPPVAASGAWQTHLRAKNFTDLIVTDDAVWCATAEAGLLRFDRVAHSFQPIPREPGTIASNHLTCLAYDRVGRLWVGTAESGVSRLTADGTRWDLVNAFDGLPVDSVTTMTVSGDTLWIGTRGGIALWDGRQVLGSLPDGNTVSFDTTFSTPAITGVVTLGDTLWLATPRGVGYAHTASNLTDWRPANAGLPTLEVQHLASDGRVVFALAANAVFQWVPDSSRWVFSAAIGTVYRLSDDHGQVLAATSSGIWKYTGFGFIPVPGGSSASDAAGLGAEPTVDPQGAVHYAGSVIGLWEEAPGGGPWTSFTPPGPPGNGYANVVIDGSRVYAATRLEGIGRWDGSTWFAWLPTPSGCGSQCANTFVNPFEVFGVLADRQGEKWVSCWRRSLDHFDDSVAPPLFTHLWTNSGDDTRHTLAFGSAADSSGGRWFGMDTDNLGVVDPLGLDYYDASGAWAGTWGPGSPANSLVRAGKIRAITVDKTGRKWIGYAGGANSGVDHFSGLPESGPNADFRTVPNTTSLDIWGLSAQGDNIWVLTDRDLRRINRAASPPRVVETFTTPAGRPLGMRLLDTSPDGSVWVGSEEGVRWYRTDGTTQDFTTANSPLASNEIRAVAVERATGAVWIGTADGLNRFDPGYQPPALPVGMADTLHVFPSPATLTGVGVELRLQGSATAYDGGIYDLNGRLLHRFSVKNRAQVFWDGRDDDGTQVKPGIYFVRAVGGGRDARARFVLLH